MSWHRRTQIVATVGVATGLFLLILAVDGLLPGLITDGPWGHLTLGGIQCVSESSPTTRCSEIGAPGGFQFLSNGPVVYLGALFDSVPGVGRYGAYLLAGAMFIAISLAGSTAFMLQIGAGRIVGFGAAVAFLLSSSMVGLQGFGGTFIGFSLIGAFAYADILSMRALEAHPSRRISAVLAAYAIGRTLLLFIDGYAFLASLLLTAGLGLSWLGSSSAELRWRRAVQLAAFIGVANAIATIAYKVYVPDPLPSVGIDYFRAMAADVVTLVTPSAEIGWAHAVGLDWNHGALWGDGNNANYNYLGLVCSVLGAAGLWLGRRREWLPGIAVAGLLGLGLALGPSLKVNDRAPTVSARPGAESYEMPADRAVAALPWGKAFTRVPGLRNTRAVYRWLTVTRFALIALAATALATLAGTTRRRRIAATVLAITAVLEVTPNIAHTIHTHREQRRGVVGLEDATVGFLQTHVPRGSRVFFLNYDGTDNDYTVNNIAVAAGLTTFNSGGDKNVEFAVADWPASVADLAQRDATADMAYAALASGEVDAIIVPFFHLRWSAYSWPPAEQERAQALSAFAPLLTDPRFRVKRSRWIATIRLDESSEAGTSAANPSPGAG